MSYAINFTEIAANDLDSYPFLKNSVENKLRFVSVNPKFGKALGKALTGLRRVIVGQNRKYRLIYRIEEDQQIVWVIKIGPREQGSAKDIYTILNKDITKYWP